MIAGTPNARKFKRKPVSARAWIDLNDGSPWRECEIMNASTGGLLVSTTPDSGHIPDRFLLRLSQTAKGAKLCRVRWRKRWIAGIEYIGRREDKPG
jgi:hypothetical protein